ncbi:MAG: SBBP repeat-containing protein [Thermacetogeniaceae bacterium]
MADDNIQDDCAPETISGAVEIQVMDAFKGLPFIFIPNAGQAHSKVSHYGDGSGCRIFFTPEEVVFAFNETPPYSEKEDQASGFALYMRFIGANPTPPEGQVESSGKVSYFIGNDPDKWHTGLPTYEEIIYRNLWRNVDLVFKAESDEVKYEFIVHPGADISTIGLVYSGANQLELDENGNILIQTPFGVLTDRKPTSYQIIDEDKVPIESNFLLGNNETGENQYGFTVGADYDPSYTLVIDPGLSFSYMVEKGFDGGLGIAVDNSGYAYVTGFTQSVDFPVTPGVFQTVLRGFEDAFVSVINPSTSGAASLVYSTYLGGCGFDRGLGIAVDNSGNAYVTGLTQSVDFPVTPGAFQTMLKGHGNAFIAVINTTASDAASLVYSTYLGGTRYDGGYGIAIDTTGNAYITGLTQSVDFPVTPGAFQTMLKGHGNAFVSVINTTAYDAAGLVYSTYLGGSRYDKGQGIALDNTGNSYVTGYACSRDFPVTTSAYQPVLNSKAGGSNAFVARINTSVSGTDSLIYSTYLGGRRHDRGYSIAVDAAYNAYVTGSTRSSDFPVTSGAYQRLLKSIYCGANCFVSKINTNATGSISLAYSTYLGGSKYDEGHGITVDTAGNAYVTGYTYSKDFPVTPDNACQPMLRSIYGGSNAFVAMINTNKSGNASLPYSTYLGGSCTDAGNGIALDRNSIAYVTGRTQSCNFPITSGAFQVRLRGCMNAFVTGINTQAKCSADSGPGSLVYSTFLGGN